MVKACTCHCIQILREHVTNQPVIFIFSDFSVFLSLIYLFLQLSVVFFIKESAWKIPEMCVYLSLNRIFSSPCLYSWLLFLWHFCPTFPEFYEVVLSYFCSVWGIKFLLESWYSRHLWSPVAGVNITPTFKIGPQCHQKKKGLFTLLSCHIFQMSLNS